jgi:hypothetical protein
MRSRQIGRSISGRRSEVAENPYKFNVGDRVTVVAISQHQGLTGKVVKRTRQRAPGVGWLMGVIGNYPKENIYYVAFEEGGKRYAFGEGNLVAPSGAGTP